MRQGINELGGENIKCVYLKKARESSNRGGGIIIVMLITEKNRTRGEVFCSSSVLTQTVFKAQSPRKLCIVVGQKAASPQREQLMAIIHI